MENIRLFAGAIILLFAANSIVAQNSVLSTGNWYKIAVENTGIHQVTYENLSDYGIDPDQVNPKHIRLYGNGNGMLPEDDAEFRYDDLQENSIFIYGEDDESFDPGDYILFYGEGPTEWNLNEESGLFEHEVNLYSDFTYYFLTTDLGEGKRIETQYSTIIPPTYTSTSFNDYYYHELELENLIHSGRRWFGERFEETIEYNYSYTFTNLITNQPVILTSEVAARSTVTSNFNFDINEGTILSTSVPPTNSTNVNATYAETRWDTVTFNVNGTTLNLKITYDKPNDSAIAWLDYFTINVKKNNIFETGQMPFRDIQSASPGLITNFQIISGTGNFTIWNITDPINPSSIDYTYSGGSASFTAETDSLLEFIAFDDSQYFSAAFEGQIENQNLQDIDPPDFIIITHEDFKTQAQQLADFRESNDGITTFVTTPQKVYNEFSSGSQDITAFRDFIKYIFGKSNGEKPENLLLFGDASFDYKNIIYENSNYIPIWESPESLNPVGSYCTDDFYSDFDNDGKKALYQIGIGRLPVKSTQEAIAIVDKIIHYSSAENAFGSWRNEICFIGDDEDYNLHFKDSEKLAMIVDTTDPVFNISKIYLDAYVQENGSNGQTYPDVNEAITDKINDGVLVINYIGHGSHNWLAHERVLTPEDLDNWTNDSFYPLMFAATCTFGRVDDPDRYSMTEQALLLEGKGMSAIIAATRATYAGGNLKLQRKFYKTIMVNQDYTLGKAFKIAKQQTGSDQNTKKQCLFGDPSMRLAIPEYKVITEIINGVLATEPMDTLNPGEQVIISGFIVNPNDEPIYNFNGNLEVRVYDRIDTLTTLKNDPSSYVANYLLRESILLIMNTQVLNGQFVFSFNLPYTLEEAYGNIKLSYYAKDSPIDARGQFSDLVVGGPPNSVPENISLNKKIVLYPTLVVSEINYLANQNINELKLNLFDITGRNILTFSDQNIQAGSKNSVSLIDLKQGLYIVHVNADGLLSTFKIIKQ